MNGSLDDVRRLRFVYRLWTANEALLKATGEGLTFAARMEEHAFDAPPDFDGPPIGRAGRTWRVASGDLDLEGCFAVAIESGPLETPRVEWRRRALADWLAERRA